MTDKNVDSPISVLSKRQVNRLCLEEFLGNSSQDFCHEEYFELKSKYDCTRKINEKIYNYAIEKILNSS